MGTQDTSTVLTILRNNYKSGLQAIDILNSITDLFRNLFYFKYLPEDKNFTSLSNSEKELVKSCNEIISAKDLSRILDMLDEVNQSIKTSPSQELKLELFLVRLIKPQLASDIKSVTSTFVFKMILYSIILPSLSLAVEFLLFDALIIKLICRAF